MQLKGLKTIVKGKERAITLPNKKSIVLTSDEDIDKEQVVYLIETLLSREYTDYYAKIDRNYGKTYLPLSKISVLDFTNGKIIGKNSTIKINGTIPNIHCVRYVSHGIIRSFLCQNTEKNGICELNYNMTRYTKEIPELVWVRLIETVNKFLGYKVVDLVDNELRFNFTQTSYTIEAQKIIYMLISECMLTPNDYLRVVLLSDIECLTPKQQFDLILTLDNIKGHEMLVSCGEVDGEDSVVKYIKI